MLILTLTLLLQLIIFEVSSYLYSIIVLVQYSIIVLVQATLEIDSGQNLRCRSLGRLTLILTCILILTLLRVLAHTLPPALTGRGEIDAGRNHRRRALGLLAGGDGAGAWGGAQQYEV